MKISRKKFKSDVEFKTSSKIGSSDFKFTEDGMCEDCKLRQEC